MEDWRLEPARDHELPICKRLRSPSRESGLIETVGHLLWTSFSRFYLGVYHRLEVTGRSNLPAEPPFILISNHTSHLDAMVLGATLQWGCREQCFPIAAGDTFFQTPLLTAFAAGFLNALPMWRHHSGRHTLGRLRARLVEQPCVYILFPEGTRARDGKLASFKLGLGMIVAGQDVPVVPCHIQGAYESAPPGCRLPRPRRIVLRIGESLVFNNVENDRDGWSVIAQQAEAAVRRLACSTATPAPTKTRSVQP